MSEQTAEKLEAAVGNISILEVSEKDGFFKMYAEGFKSTSEAKRVLVKDEHSKGRRFVTAKISSSFGVGTKPVTRTIVGIVE